MAIDGEEGAAADSGEWVGGEAGESSGSGGSGGSGGGRGGAEAANHGMIAIISLQETTFAQVLCTSPIPKAAKITCIRFSASCRYLLVGYGVCVCARAFMRVLGSMEPLLAGCGAAMRCGAGAGADEERALRGCAAGGRDMRPATAERLRRGLELYHFDAQGAYAVEAHLLSARPPVAAEHRLRQGARAHACLDAPRSGAEHPKC